MAIAESVSLHSNAGPGDVSLTRATASQGILIPSAIPPFPLVYINLAVLYRQIGTVSSMPDLQNLDLSDD